MSPSSTTIVTMPIGGTSIVVVASDVLPASFIAHMNPLGSCETSLNVSCTRAGSNTGALTVTGAAPLQFGPASAAASTAELPGASGITDDPSSPHAMRNTNDTKRSCLTLR